MHLAAYLPHKIFAILLGEMMHRRDVSKASFSFTFKASQLMHYDFPVRVLFFMALPLYSRLFLCSLCFSVAEN